MQWPIFLPSPPLRTLPPSFPLTLQTKHTRRNKDWKVQEVLQCISETDIKNKNFHEGREKMKKQTSNCFTESYWGWEKETGIIKNYLPWTARAETPVFSIRLASSTVSWDDFKSRILHVTGVSKFLFNVVKIWFWKEAKWRVKYKQEKFFTERSGERKRNKSILRG